MRPRIVRALVIALLVCTPVLLAGTSARAEAGPAYDDLVDLFEQWRGFQPPRFVDGVPDYSATAMARQHRELAGYQDRLQSLDVTDWPVSQQIDWWLVRAEMNGLDFDHRVLRPWARDPAFYAMIVDSESDTPLKEGPVIAGAIELWKLSFPLAGEELERFGDRLRTIPALLEQARENLTGEARDLWRLGIRSQQGQSAQLQVLADLLAQHHPDLVPAAEEAQRAVDQFVVWLEEQLPAKQAPSGIGIDNYTWYLQNVHLLPYSWAEEMQLMQREWARAVSQMKLEEHQNRHLPALEPPEDAVAWDRRNEEATVEFMRFLDEEDVLEVEDFMEPALRERLIGWTPPGQRHFFLQVALRDPRVLHCHFIHWLEKAYLRQHPHSSPIRRLPSLYNIWDSRSEGLATGMEEMMMSAGMFTDSPRSRELVYIMIAMRAARAMAGLRVQANEWTVDQAVDFAAAATPRGWFRADGNLVLFEQQLYLQQPGYGTSYLTGKALIDDLLADRSMQLGEDFSLERFMSELFGAGMIPVSLGRWEMTGQRDWLPASD